MDRWKEGGKLPVEGKKEGWKEGRVEGWEDGVEGRTGWGAVGGGSR